MDLSVVVPAFNEQDSVGMLHKRLTSVLAKLARTYEVIFVDDGSTDRTFDVMSRLHLSDEHVKVIKFRSNFGQTAAILAGFQQSKGKVIVTIDSDLQNFPEDIPMLLDKMRDGYDVVCGWRHDRRDAFFSKKLPSMVSNWLVRRLMKIDIHDSGCTLKAYRREAIEGLRIYGEMHRYIPAIIAAKGFKVGEAKVRHRERYVGITKYGVTRLMKGLLDLFYVKFWSSYSTKPLHFFGLLGIIQYFLSGAVFVEQVIKAYLLKQFTAGPLFIISVLLAITGTQFIVFGFLGEVLIRAYYSNSKDASYSIEKVLE